MSKSFSNQWIKEIDELFSIVLEDETDTTIKKLLLMENDDDFFAFLNYLCNNTPAGNLMASQIKKHEYGELVMERMKKIIAKVNRNFFSVKPEDPEPDTEKLTDKQLQRLDIDDLKQIRRRHDLMHGRSIWQREPSKYVRVLVDELIRIKTND